MSALRLPAPAKLNLFLHITGRRADGYHLLQTLFCFLDYCDTITLTLPTDTEIRRVKGNESFPPESDLTVKAARLLQTHTGCNKGVDIAIEKIIPMGGGLGGGSSDAATVLVGLNQLWDCKLAKTELMQLGLKLGADVPVFIGGQAAWAEGVGELLTPVELPEKWYLVVAPAAHVVTAEIFSHPDLTRNCEPIKMATFLTGQTQNVFETVVRETHSEVNKVFKTLEMLAKPKLTGSGACVFVECLTPLQAQEIQQKLPPTWITFVAKGLSKSPLATQLLN